MKRTGGTGQRVSGARERVRVAAASRVEIRVRQTRAKTGAETIAGAGAGRGAAGGRAVAGRRPPCCTSGDVVREPRRRRSVTLLLRVRFHKPQRMCLARLCHPETRRRQHR